MNDHQQVAAFIISKLRQAPMTGDESELVSTAKQWLIMIQNGQFQIVDTVSPKKEAGDKDKQPDADPKSPGNGEVPDEPVHE